MQLDQWVWSATESLSETKFLAKLSEGDLVALKVHYHKACLFNLYDRARDWNKKKLGSRKEENLTYEIVLGEIIDYIK